MSILNCQVPTFKVTVIFYSTFYNSFKAPKSNKEKKNHNNLFSFNGNQLKFLIFKIYDSFVVSLSINLLVCLFFAPQFPSSLFFFFLLAIIASLVLLRCFHYVACSRSLYFYAVIVKSEFSLIPFI